MNKITFTLVLLLASLCSYGQVYLEQFDTDIEGQFWLSDGYESSVSDGEWTITGNGTAGQYSIFAYLPADEAGNAITVDASGNNKIYVRAKASSNGTQLRMDIKDADGYVTSVPGISKFLIADYTVYEFDFTGNLNDGGFGGTPCTADTQPCPVDASRVAEFQFYPNPVQGGFAGSVVIDFIAVGSQPQVGPMSDIFQDHFDDTTSLRFIGTSTPSYENIVEESLWKIKGDGTNGMWEPVSIVTYNTSTLEEVDVSVKDGEDKVYIRMRSTVPGTSIRLDLQDVNAFATTAGSVTQVITEEFATYEYSFAGVYQDLAYGGTGCTEGGPACDVDPDRISNMILFVNPGVEAFAGEVHIDYISIGTPLEVVDENNELAYSDHFSSGEETFVNTGGAYQVSVDESILSITGDGSDVPFSNVAYTPNQDGAAVLVNATGNNKVFIKARSTVDNTLLRVDLIDSAQYATTTPSFTRILSTDYQVLEINFTNQYFDAGYGGTSCDEGSAPCPVDGTAIETMLLYPNPADGGFSGTIEIDYISFGSPLGDDVDVFAYGDEFDDGDASKVGQTEGIVVTENEGVLTFAGNGTSGAFAAMPYTPHNQETGEDFILDITSNNKVYIKAKASKPLTLRMDVQDSDGFASTEPSTSVSVNEEYQILEFDFTGTYMDGGYGGTSCASENAPCAVDGSRINLFVFYIDPGTGMFDGELQIEWLSTLEPLEEDMIDLGPIGVDSYEDDFAANDLTFMSDNTGQALSISEGIVTITGDGSMGPYAPIGYATNDGTDTIRVNASSNANKVYLRMKSSVDSTKIRLDLVDNLNYHTTLAGLENTIGTEYEIYEYDYSGNYSDGGYGGTACLAGPCNVDSERIEQLQLYINPGVGAFSGTVDIDWIAFGEPITSSIIESSLVEKASIFPNPAHNEFYLKMNTKVEGNLKATLMDISGRVVSVQDLGFTSMGDFQKTVSVEGFLDGLYFLRVSLDNKTVLYQKVAVQ